MDCPGWVGEVHISRSFSLSLSLSVRCVQCGDWTGLLWLNDRHSPGRGQDWVHWLHRGELAAREGKGVSWLPGGGKERYG